MTTVFRPASFAFLLLVAALAGCIIWQTGGHFTFTIDDPYIHLALAENLPGHYGPWSGEQVSVSSSIIYPWLLIPFAKGEWTGPLAALLLNILAGLGILWALAQAELVIGATTQLPRPLRATLLLVLLAAFNIYGTIFMGMEHTLHVAACLLILLGWWRWGQREPLPLWFWAALVAAPLLRFESLALCGITLLTLLVTGPRRPALITTLIIAVTQTAHASYLHSMNLGWLPQSVRLKSPVTGALSDGADIFEALTNLINDLSIKLIHNDALYVFLLSTILLGVAIITRWEKRGRLSWMLLVTSGLGVAHILGAQFGWLGRFSAYLIAFQMLMLAYWALAGQRSYSRKDTIFVTILIVCALMVGNQQRFIVRAATQTWEQPAQIRNFITTIWQKPVTALDVGYISWRNDLAVADLYGLISPTMFGYRQHYKFLPPAQLKSFMAAYKAPLMIGFDQHMLRFVWPSSGLIKVGQLDLSTRQVLLPPTTSFMIADASLWPEVYEKLEEWRKTLPAGVVLTTVPPPAPSQ